MYLSEILADSVGPHRQRLTTFAITFPRMVLSELNTHRMLSRNAESSRAVPIEQKIAQVRESPYIPTFLERTKGMGGGAPLTGGRRASANSAWLAARDQAVKSAIALIGTSKQHANRLLEPFAWVTCIVSATEWDNFFELRCAENAQPEIAKIARMMYMQRALSVPESLAPGDWHLPLLPNLRSVPHRLDDIALAQVSAGRCARVSYLNHYREEPEEAALARCERLVADGHWSPLEHPARCEKKPDWYANYRGFESLRHILQNGN